MGFPRFIAVQKVVRDREGVLGKASETIRLDFVRSIRKWNKTTEESRCIEEDITVLYMMQEDNKVDDNTEEVEAKKGKRPRIGSKGKDSGDTKIRIAESKAHFDQRVSAILEMPSIDIKPAKAD